MRRRTFGLALALGLVLAAGGCAGGTDAGPRGGVSDRGQAVRLVVLGDQRAVGEPVRDTLHDGWPQVLFRTKLPSRTVYVDLAGDGETVADTRSHQLPQVAALDPTLVVVWVGQEDRDRGTDDATFAGDLAALVDELKAGGAQVVLVAGTPYRDVITRTGEEHGAKVADVSAVDVEGGGTQAQERVADQVARVIGPLG